MASHQLAEAKLSELAELAEGWGKIVAEHSYGEDGPNLDVDLAGIEEIAVCVSRALVKGTCEELTRRQARRLPDVQPCPDCGQECAVERAESADQKPRTVHVRGGMFELSEPRCYCPACRRSFFPSAVEFTDDRPWL